MNDNKLRVLHAVYCLGRGGAEKLAIDVTRELNKRENVEALLISFGKTANFEYDTDGLNYRYCPSKADLSMFYKDKIYAGAYQEALMNFKPHIIHSHRYLTEIITRYNISKDIKYVTHCHDNIRQFSKFSAKMLFSKRRLTDLYEREWIIKKYRECKDHFIAVSENNLSFLKENLPEDLHRFSLLPNAIVFSRFARKEAANGNKLKGGAIKLINIGSFVPNKNHGFLIEVLDNLRKKGYPVTLDFLGDGTDIESIRKKVQNYGLSEFVFFRGSVRNVEDYLHNSDIYVHSAKSESFGLVLLEAMAAGLPVVCLDAKGNRDILKDGYNGLMVNVPDVDLFTNKIIQLLSNQDLYYSISDNAVKFARDFDIGEYVNRLVNLYKTLLEEK